MCGWLKQTMCGPQYFVIYRQIKSTCHKHLNNHRMFAYQPPNLSSKLWSNKNHQLQKKQQNIKPRNNRNWINTKRSIDETHIGVTSLSSRRGRHHYSDRLYQDWVLCANSLNKLIFCILSDHFFPQILLPIKQCFTGLPIKVCHCN